MLTSLRPVEIHQVHLRPADFFTVNPAIDVPGTKNESAILASDEEACCASGTMQQDPSTHMQGTGPDLDPRSKL